MILFFPDLNAWMALTVEGHVHGEDAWRWMRQLPADARLLFSRYTQLGLLRLLTSEAVMGGRTLTLHKAWQVYDHWLEDSRVEFYPEPRDMDVIFRQCTAAVSSLPATKAMGDCWLLAQAISLRAALVTFDQALLRLARKQKHPAFLPA